MMMMISYSEFNNEYKTTGKVDEFLRSMESRFFKTPNSLKQKLSPLDLLWSDFYPRFFAIQFPWDV